MCSLKGPWGLIVSLRSLSVLQDTQTEHTHTHHTHTFINTDFSMHALSWCMLVIVIIVTQWENKENTERFLSWSQSWNFRSCGCNFLISYLFQSVLSSYLVILWRERYIVWYRYIQKCFFLVSICRHRWMWDSGHVHERPLCQHWGILPLWVYGRDGSGPGWTGLCWWVHGTRVNCVIKSQE